MSSSAFAPVRNSERAAEPTQAALWSRGAETWRSAGRCNPGQADCSFEAVGWRIGLDHARWGLTPPHDHLHPGNPVREGWISGRQRPLRRVGAVPAARDLLDLRLQCWRDGRVFDAHSVTPRLLDRMRPLRCPVTRQPMGQGLRQARAIVLHEGAACAAGNIAFVQARVANIAHGLGLALVLDRARDAQTAEQQGAQANPPPGLQAVEWKRLASLIGLATPMSHEQAAQMPLHLTPPLNTRVLNPEHALQALLSSTAALPASEGAAALELLGRTVPASARRALFVLCSALLARRLQVPPAMPQQVSDAIEDAWGDERVAHCWGRFIAPLSRSQCEEIVALAAGSTSMGRRRWRVLSDDDAVDGWALAPEQAQISQS